MKSHRIYPRAYPKARYNGSEHCWTFPSGAKIYFGSMPNTTSFVRYQGLSFAFIGFDELTHFTQQEYEYLISRNRADGPGTRVYIRATANPGGIGHGWVKARFITPVPPGVTQTVKLKVENPNGEKIEMTRKRIFIKSSVFDNEKLLENDPNYLANLASLPDAQRRALLYGDWDSFEGQVFTEWRDNPEGYSNKKNTHVIEPFKIPKHWRRYRSFDFGYSKPFAVQWWAVDEDGTVYLYRQLYGCKKDSPNVGLQWEPHEIARKIREIEDTFERGNKIIGVADPSIWDNSRGKEGTVITMMEREGVYFNKGKNDRLSGLMQFHHRLAFDKNGRPALYVFKTCRQFIRTIPNLIYSTVNVEDIDTTQEDHDYDACRYFLMENPIAARIDVEEPIKHWSPLDI